MGFAIEKVGTWSESTELLVDASASIAYAQATNDPIEAHCTGVLAPPLFAVVPIWDALGPAVASVTPSEAVMFGLHGEHDLWIHRPIKPGMLLTSRAAPVGIHVKGSGTTVIVKAETRDTADGELVNEQFMTAFFRGFSEGDGKGETAPTHLLDDATKTNEQLGTFSAHVDEDQTFRYSKASGDTVPLHLDAEIAKSAGLPGIIAHGLCTMAFLSWGVINEVGGGDPTRLARLAVRFARPVLPNQDLSTTIWNAGTGASGNTLVAFETAVGDQVVVKDGLAEFRP